MQPDAIDKVITNAINVMESSKYQLFEIAESSRLEKESLTRELNDIKHETGVTIDLVDMLEKEYKRSRIRLTEVSRDFNKYREEDIKIAYEAAIAFQLQLTVAREKENNLKIRRNDLQVRMNRAAKAQFLYQPTEDQVAIEVATEDCPSRNDDVNC